MSSLSILTMESDSFNSKVVTFVGALYFEMFLWVKTTVPIIRKRAMDIMIIATMGTSSVTSMYSGRPMSLMLMDIFSETYLLLS
jgi:hypothetical protein